MDLAQIRERFRQHCGPANFADLVRDFHRRCIHNPFPTWEQEQLWDEFTRVHPAAPFTPQLLHEVLNVCPIHLCELATDTVPIIYGLITGNVFELTNGEEFPLANNVILGGCDVDDQIQTGDVEYCAECRAVKTRCRIKRESQE